MDVFVTFEILFSYQVRFISCYGVRNPLCAILCYMIMQESSNDPCMVITDAVLCLVCLQALHETFPKHTFLMNGLVQGVKVSSVTS